jgi:hypothetical protein
MAREKKRWPWVLGGLLALLIAYCLYAYWPYDNRITISPETTYLTEPVNRDGTVNYVAAIDLRIREGVTDENNAAPLLIRAVGPSILREEILPLSLEKLGMKELPPDGTYLIGWRKFVRKQAPKEGLDVDEQLAAEGRRVAGREAPWSQAERPLLAAWLQANRGPLELVTRAVQRPRFYIPVPCLTKPPNLWDRGFPTLTCFSMASNALATRAMLKLGEGDTASARADLLTCHRLARLVAQDPTLVGQLVVIAIEATACESDFALAGSGCLSRQEAMAYLAELNTLKALPPILRIFDEYERYCALDVVMRLYHGGGLDATTGSASPEELRRSIHWDTMLRIVNDWRNRIVEAYGTPRSRRRAAMARLEKEIWAIPGRMGKSWEKRTRLLSYGGRPFRGAYTREMTDLVLTMALSIPGRALELYDEALVKLDLARTSLALAAWKADRGAYPTKLDKLTPEYLVKVPKDIFSGKPLIYRRVGEGYVLYSVGGNLIDDRGKRDEDREPEDAADDITVEAEK